jgi:NAD(P)-dependent dehydrogenase (short-subunit alcohol dehydrogenase family)
MKTPDLFDLSGKTALVSGGGRGIGRHIALGLAEAGADVFVVGRSQQHLDESVRALKKTGQRAWALQADLSDERQIEQVVERALATSPRLDILVNNAARVWSAPTLDYPIDGWDKVFALNVRALWLLSQRVARHMKENASGSIINIASISAWLGAPEEEQNVIAYNSSKGAVVSLTNDLAVKLAPHGVRVNAIAPGPFLTDMMNHIRHDEAALKAYESGIPLGRSGTEDDIKGVAVFLASAASSFVIGQTLVADGGITKV